MGDVRELRVHRSLMKALKLFDADRLRWLDEAAGLGRVVALRLGPVTTWVVSDAEAARAMLVAESASWTRPPALRIPVRVGVGENLFTQTQKAWALLQPAVAPAFRKSALQTRVADLDALVADEVRALPHDTTIDLDLAMGRLALRAAAWVLLGEQLDRCRAEELAYHQREVVGWVGGQLARLSGVLPVALGVRGREMRGHRAVLRAYADEVIGRAQRRNATGDDVLGALLSARRSGRRLTPGELRSHVLGLFLAGNETTAAALSWALVHGAQSPGDWQALRSSPEQCTLPFVNETLRLHPPVWGLLRTPTRSGVSLTVEGLRVPIRRGQGATVYVRGINRDPTLWHDPMRFDPARHDAAGSAQPRALLAFGLGPRGCIGQHLAIAELTSVLPALARHGCISVDEPVREDPNVALRVLGGLTGYFSAPTRTPPTPVTSRT